VTSSNETVRGDEGSCVRTASDQSPSRQNSISLTTCQKSSCWHQYSHSPWRPTPSREPDQNIAEILEHQHFTLSQSPSDLDAEHLRNACTALLLAAKQLLAKTQQLTAIEHRDNCRTIPVNVRGSFLDADEDSPPTINYEISSETHSTPTDCTTCSDVVDTQSLNLDWWSGCSLWQPNDDAGDGYAFGSTSGCAGLLYGGADWLALQADDWPCFPG
jgi:hypothetical protein